MSVILGLLLSLMLGPVHAGFKEERSSIISYCNDVKTHQVDVNTNRSSPSYALELRQNKRIVRYFFFCRLWGQTASHWSGRRARGQGEAAKQEVRGQIEQARDLIWVHFFNLHQSKEDIVFKQASLPAMLASLSKRVFPTQEVP